MGLGFCNETQNAAGKISSCALCEGPSHAGMWATKTELASLPRESNSQARVGPTLSENVSPLQVSVLMLATVKVPSLFTLP